MDVDKIAEPTEPDQHKMEFDTQEHYMSGNIKLCQWFFSNQGFFFVYSRSSKGNQCLTFDIFYFE